MRPLTVPCLFFLCLTLLPAGHTLLLGLALLAPGLASSPSLLAEATVVANVLPPA